MGYVLLALPVTRDSSVAHPGPLFDPCAQTWRVLLVAHATLAHATVLLLDAAHAMATALLLEAACLTQLGLLDAAHAMALLLEAETAV